jgi:hypothetical protein
MAKMGNTQGMAFKIKPPRRAAASASMKPNAPSYFACGVAMLASVLAETYA